VSAWLGLLLGTQRSEQDPAAVYAAVRAEARAAAEGGFSALVAPEHLHAEPYRMLQPWPLLGALREAVGAPVTAVGSVIAGLTTAPRLAAELATLRGIGEGPVGVALAAGYRPEDFAAGERDFGRRFERRGAILEALAAGEACDTGWLWSAAGTEKAAVRAGEAGVPFYGAPTLPVADAAAMARAAGAGCVLRRDVLLARDDRDLGARWERYVAPKYGAYAAWGYASGAAGGEVIAGTASQVGEELASVAAETGAEGLVLRLCWPDMDAPVALDHVEAFTAEVAGGQLGAEVAR
jgi:alkanesulfonate monooxygenase SsuD/methylene tetrahydromethanopterin reductase-like flavin-dependent oxidoreductase (luciferase family)